MSTPVSTPTFDVFPATWQPTDAAILALANWLVAIDDAEEAAAAEHPQEDAAT